MEIRLELLTFSFAAGFWAFLNPCAFAMLPAYVASYLNTSNDSDSTTIYSAARGMTLGIVVSGGFLTVFVLVGIGVSVFSGAFGRYYPWIGTAMGVLLIVLGVFMVAGKNLLMLHVFERLAGRISQAKSNTSQRKLNFFYFYGVSYALASLGCAFPIFIPVVVNSFSSNFLNGIAQFGFYALGMTLPMIGLSLLMVFSKEFVERSIPVVMKAMGWLSGIVVIAAGIYLIWYYLFYTNLLVL